VEWPNEPIRSCELLVTRVALGVGRADEESISSMLHTSMDTLTSTKRGRQLDD
jgi:hypothetical protein